MTDTATATHTVRRLSVPLGLPYAEAIRRFEDLLPVVDLDRFTALENWDDVVTLAGRTAPLGLMRFWALDVRSLLVGGRALSDCTEFLVGNHVIAERMYRYDPVAMMYAPLRFLIRADRAGEAVCVFEQPSTQFDSLGRAEISAVGRELDRKVATLLTTLGATPPPGLAG
ncbi:hypothetical protein ACQPZQ_32530 [Pseudonocardia sp. CA-142604]|uniref:hypothetical protein n=1 Tax=Pseudonocardia sp. CA-142604 TaxID=3240024 RepID=UPI003D92EA77